MPASAGNKLHPGLLWHNKNAQKGKELLADQKKSGPKKKHDLGARSRGRTATQRSKKGSEKVLERGLGKGFSEGF